MEAVANHSFCPTESDELGFEKGNILHIIGMEEDPNWYKAKLGNQEGMIPANYITLYPHPWYIPKCSRLEAEARLLELDSRLNKDVQPDGAFILRQSENGPGQFSISVKEGSSVLHFRVFSDPNGKYYVWTNKFNSINQLIDYHRSQTIYGAKTLLLRNCVPSKTFGPVGSGPNAVFNNPRLNANSSSRNNRPTTQSESTHKERNASDSGNISSSGNHTAMTNAAAISAGTSGGGVGGGGGGNVSGTNLPPGVSSTQLAGRLCVAKFDFNAEFEEEMSFRRNDRLRILGEEDENWWFAEIIHPANTNRSRGLIPANYVELLPASSGDNLSQHHSSRTHSKTSQQQSTIRSSNVT